MFENKKRRQHYVWRHYLDGWTTDQKLWCHRQGKLFHVSPQNVAHRRDFYRLREMSEYDLYVVRKLVIEQLPHPLRDVAEGWIPHFTLIFAIQRQLNTTSSVPPTAQRELDAAINNLEENMHSDLETKGLPLLNALRARATNVFDNDDDSVEQTWFLAAQYFRTPRMLNSIVEALRKLQSFNAEAAFGLMRTIFANNVGYSLWMKRHQLRLTYLDASNYGSLVTGDQPVLNTRAQPNVPPDSLELYYPLTPTLGALFDFDAGTKTTVHRKLNPVEVNTYNQLIYTASDGVVYGADRDTVAAMSGETVSAQSPADTDPDVRA